MAVIDDWYYRAMVVCQDPAPVFAYLPPVVEEAPATEAAQ